MPSPPCNALPFRLCNRTPVPDRTATTVVALVRLVLPWLIAPAEVAPMVPPAAMVPTDCAMVVVDHRLILPTAAIVPPDWVKPATPVARDPRFPATPEPAPMVNAPSEEISPADWTKLPGVNVRLAPLPATTMVPPL